MSISVDRVKEIAEGLEQRFGSKPLLMVLNAVADLVVDDTKSICTGMEKDEAKICFLALLRLHLGFLHVLNSWGDATPEELEEELNRLNLIQLYDSVHSSTEEWVGGVETIKEFILSKLKNSSPRTKRLALLDLLLLALGAVGFKLSSLVHVAYVYVSRRSGYEFSQQDLEIEDQVLKFIAKLGGPAHIL